MFEQGSLQWGGGALYIFLLKSHHVGQPHLPSFPSWNRPILRVRRVPKMAAEMLLWEKYEGYPRAQCPFPPLTSTLTPGHS